MRGAIAVLLVLVLVLPAFAQNFSDAGCDSMSNQNARDTCYNQLAGTTENPEYCRMILEDNLGVEPALCFSNLAQLKNSHSICYMIKDKAARESCQDKVTPGFNGDTLYFVLRENAILLIFAIVIIGYVIYHFIRQNKRKHGSGDFYEHFR